MHISPTRLLCNAALSSGEITTPSGKTVVFKREEFKRGELSGTCWLCGYETKAGFPQKKIIKPTFTDGDLAKAPHSDVVCEYCTWSISHRPLRNYSLFATAKKLEFPSRAQWRSLLLNPPEERCLCVLAVSGQKWLHFKGKISEGGYPLHVMLEEQPVCVTEGFADILADVEALYWGEFSKTEIEAGQYQSDRILKHGISRWERIEDRLAKVRGSRIFDLALFVASQVGYRAISGDIHMNSVAQKEGN